MCGDATAGRGEVAPRARTAPGDPLALEPVERLRVTCLVDNTVDLLASDVGPAERASLLSSRFPVTVSPLHVEGAVPDAPLAEHGFSVLVEVSHRGAEARVLFDAGLSPDGLVTNMRRLGLDPRDVDVVVLSHGHLDHVTGLDGFVRAVGRRNLPVILHPDAWRRRRITVPGRDAVELPTPSRRALEDAGFDLLERRGASLLLDGAVLVTGEVDRTSPFERGFPGHEFHDGTAWQPDPLVLDDQALVVDVRGRGLVVLTGCGHAGVVNIVHHARRRTGVSRVHAVLGGFHLSGPRSAPLVAPTVAALRDVAPDVVVPAHCTGWHASLALATALPDAFVPNSVGTRYEFVAAA